MECDVLWQQLTSDHEGQKHESKVFRNLAASKLPVVHDMRLSTAESFKSNITLY